MTSYNTIIKTTGLIGGVQLITLFFALIKNKLVALLLDRDGIGAFGLYTGFTDMLTNICGLGMNQSASRQIAKASALNSSNKIAKSIYVLRRAVFIPSLIGAAFMCINASAISIYLFSTEANMWAVMLLSTVIIFNGISYGQQALLNGLRRINDLAICRIFGALCSSLFTIVIIYLLSSDGIPLSIVFAALCNLLSSWWFVSRMQLKPTCPEKREVLEELKGLLGIGISFAAAGIVASAMAVVSRSYITDKFGLAVLGEYMACWNISNLYIGIILGAMGIDFMPRLAVLLKDKEKTNEVVNQQIELGLLLAGFGVLGILAFSPLVLTILYSSRFAAATEIIHWQILGVGLRVLAWPFGYVLTSHGMGVKYIAIQSLFYISDFALLVLFTMLLGYHGLGLSYAIAYSLYALIAWGTCHKATGFKASHLLLKILGFSIAFQSCSFSLSYLVSSPLYYGLQIIILLAYTLWVIKILKMHIGIDIIVKLRMFAKISRT